MSEIILKVSNINKEYSGQVVLDQVNMEVKKGAIYGFIGRNGAGKTTLMKIICGLAKESSGELQLFGSTAHLNDSRKRIGNIIELPTLYKGMTAYDNLEIQRRLLNKVRKDKIPAILEMVGLGNVGKKKAKDFSLGMKQRLALAVALLNEPDFLVLDEPINGLDPMGIVEIRETLTKLAKEQGITILISSHILTELHLLATDYGIIEEGRIMKQLSAQELADECKQFIKLTTTDNERAYALLQTAFKFKDMKLKDEGIEITDQVDDTTEIVSLLASESIGVKGINVVEQDLEAYFLSVIGGSKHA